MTNGPDVKYAAIARAQHAIGMNNKRPYTLDGVRYYRPYRNYYMTVLPDEPWQLMEWAEYAIATRRQQNGLDTATYNLTRAGLNWLGQQLDIVILDPE